jgi:hypothetical protein
MAPGPELDRARVLVEEAALAAGRDPRAIGMEGQLDFGDGDLDRLGSETHLWRTMGASHLSVNTMRAGLATVEDHIAALALLAEAVLDR